VIIVAIVGALGVAAITVVIVAVWLTRSPRSFDEGELVPLIAGTEVVDAPRETCDPGTMPAQECGAVAEVRSRDGRSATSVVAANAERAGFVVINSDGNIFEAEDRDRCLVLDPGSTDVVRVHLSRC
jgi:hypothetical protein